MKALTKKEPEDRFPDTIWCVLGGQDGLRTRLPGGQTRTLTESELVEAARRYNTHPKLEALARRVIEESDGPISLHEEIRKVLRSDAELAGGGAEVDR